MFFEGERIVAVREMILADDEDGPARRARQAAADAARGFRRAVRDHDRPAGDDPPARSAAARVPAAHRGGDRRSRQGDGRAAPTSCARAPPSCTSSIRCSASAACGSRSAIPKSPRCRRARSSRARSRPGSKTGAPVTAEIMVPLVMAQRRTRPGQDDHRRDGRGGRQGDGRQRALSGRHDDRAAARRAARRRHRRERRVLLVRHQRPDADDARRLARRRRLVPRPLHGQGPPARRSVRDARSRRASANSSRSPPSAAARRGPASSSASAASTAAIRRRIAFCENVGLDYVSCSPFRMPIARLAAAQAALGRKAASTA